ncbi:glycoside hydrolase family 26 protein [Paenibacillus sp. SI8]|uniref:glycoside hydrolase family 26 protein n=1 Tax=unclassified Paenibacillus TaxID=185978 RepID=UPI0034662036
MRNLSTNMGLKIHIILLFACSVLFCFFIPTSTVNAATNYQEGAWIGTWPSSVTDNVYAFNTKTDSKMQVVNTFVNTNQNLDQFGSTINYVDSKNAINMLTLEPFGLTTVDINNGVLDAYFEKLAEQLKGWKGGKEIWIRYLHEGNANYYSWCIGDSKINTNDSYKKAFQKTVDIFRKKGATNVKWIYNVNAENVGVGASYTLAYPGNDYVDFVSIDGYNWGNSQSWSSWKWFRQIFDKAYYSLNRYNKPTIIAEFASAEVGGDKATWIKNAYEQMDSGCYPLLKAAVWFNEKKELDWTIDSTEASLKAFQNRHK